MDRNPAAALLRWLSSLFGVLALVVATPAFGADPVPIAWARTGRALSMTGTLGGSPGEAVAVTASYLAVSSGTHASRGIVSVFPRLGRGRVGEPWEIVGRSSTFGKALAIDERHLIVTAPGTSSRLLTSATVYELRPNGAPLELQTLIEPSATSQFAIESLCLHGDELFIGAPDQRRVTYWRRSSSGTWEYAGAIVPSPSSTRFGACIATNGSLLCIGAPTSATVHVFERTAAGGWTQTQTLPAPAASSGFASSVAVCDDWIAVGAPTAPSEPTGGISNSGAVFMFARDATDRWVLDGRIAAAPTVGARTGAAVAFRGRTALITAPAALPSGSSGVFRGQLFAFERTPKGWQQVGACAWPIVPSSPNIGTPSAASMAGAGMALSSSGGEAFLTPGLLFDLSPLDCVASQSDTDGDGVQDCADEDIDGDGVPNLVDGCPFDPTSVAAGPCGCGSTVADTDGDGLADCIDLNDDGTSDLNDACRRNRLLTGPGPCGCDGAPASGTPPYDQCTQVNLGPATVVPLRRRESGYANAVGDLAVEGRRLACRIAPNPAYDPPGQSLPAMVGVVERRFDGTFELDGVIPAEPGFGAFAMREDLLFAGSTLYRRMSRGNWRVVTTAAGVAYSAAIDGGRMLLNTGSPLLVEQNTSGSWSTTWLPSTGDSRWGGTALRGAEAFVGVPYNQNAVKCYRRDGAWQLVQTVTPPVLTGADYFGVSLAVDGDWMFVGADAVSLTGSSAAICGAVYVYRRSGASPWALAQIILPEDAGRVDHFGSRLVAKDGMLLVPYGQRWSSGAVYPSAALFRQAGDGPWERVATVHSPVSVPYSYWGNVGIGDGFIAIDSHGTSPVSSGSGDATAVRVFSLRNDDANGDGLPDPDADGDGTCDAYDRCPGVPDIDTDHDGFLDCTDPQPTFPDGRDADLDGVPSPPDACPDDPLKVAPGTCGCGNTEIDTDGDGLLDCAEKDDDNDGLQDDVDPCITIFNVDTDGDGAPDCIDSDDDGDGVLDRDDFCADGRDADYDDSGIADCLELQLRPVELVPADGQPGDRFGAGIALDGGTLAVGDPARQRVTVFRRAADGWSVDTVIEPLLPTTDFGIAVSTRGGIVVIGSGAGVEVHAKRSGIGWVRTLRVVGADLGGLLGLGRAVAVGDGFFVAGASSTSQGGSGAVGAAAFGRLAPDGESLGIWRIDSPAARASGLFGRAVSVRGSRIAIAAALSPLIADQEGFVATYAVGPSGQPALEGLVHQTRRDDAFQQYGAFARSMVLDQTGAMVAEPLLGFDREASGEWRQVQFLPADLFAQFPPSTRQLVPWRQASASRGIDADEQFVVLRSTIGSTSRATVRVDRLLGAGRTAFAGFIASLPATDSTVTDGIAISGGIVAVGAPGLATDGATGPGVVRIYDLCEAPADAPGDCDLNGRVDSCEIRSGTAADDDADGMLDRCERAVGDADLDGDVDGADLALVLGAWGTGPSVFDLNGDGLVDGADLARVLANWESAG